MDESELRSQQQFSRREERQSIHFAHSKRRNCDIYQQYDIHHVISYNVLPSRRQRSI